MNSISAYCHISTRCIVINNSVVFAETETGLKGLLKEAYTRLNPEYSRFFKMDLLSKLSFLGVEVLKKQLPTIAGYAADEVALVFANSNSSEDTDHKFAASYIKDKAPSPSLFVYTLPNILIGEIAIRNGWYGENLFAVLPELDGSFFSNICNILLQKKAEACLCGWINVMEEEAEAFFFFAEKKTGHGMLSITPKVIETIYKNTYNNGKAKRRTEETNH